jgi:hypothetical protein
MVTSKFYLGTHNISWLNKTPVPLFVSMVRLRRRKKPFQFTGECAVDSGGFSELSKHGTWSITPKQYLAEVDMWSQCGKVNWFAIQDWMCEPIMLKKTGKTITQHQALTVESYLTLRSARPSIPWCPVLQGYALDDYKRCLTLYASHGVDLTALPVVGIGTVCRRQGTKEAEDIIRYFAAVGVKIHAFGFKKTGLPRTHKLIVSSDSLAWSDGARRTPILLPGCRGGTHKNCANCIIYAHKWRNELLTELEREARNEALQMQLWG